MDPELRAYLDAMRAEMAAIEQRAIARDAETGQTVRAEIAGVEERAIARDAETRQTERAEIAGTEERAIARDAETRQTVRVEVASARSEARVLHEDTLAAIKALGDGLAMNRESAERRAAERQAVLMDEHIHPLEAGARNHEDRIRALEAR